MFKKVGLCSNHVQERNAYCSGKHSRFEYGQATQVFQESIPLWGCCAQGIHTVLEEGMPLHGAERNHNCFFLCGLESGTVPPPWLLPGPLHLRFFRVACNLGADGFVAFGDCAFAGADGEAALLGAEVPSLAVWAGTSAKEEAPMGGPFGHLASVCRRPLIWVSSEGLRSPKVTLGLGSPCKPPALMRRVLGTRGSAKQAIASKEGGCSMQKGTNNNNHNC